MLAIHLGSEGVCRERLRDASVDDPVEVERGEAGHLLLARLLLCRTKEGRTTSCPISGQQSFTTSERDSNENSRGIVSSLGFPSSKEKRYGFDG